MPGIPHPALPEVGQLKILDYLLDSNHPQGAAKSRFFLAFGFLREDWLAFADALRQHGATQELRGERSNAFGQLYEIACSIITPDGRNPCVVTVWIVEGAAAPKLVTAYPA